MNVSNLIASSIRHSVEEVFSTMMNVEINHGDAQVAQPGSEPNDGVVSLIGLAGTWVGTGSVMCSPAMACRICSQMLMTEATSVDEEVLDAVAELTNIIIGNVKNDLERHLGQLGLSIPTVIFGRNFKTKSAGTADWVVERFRWDQDDLVVKLCLAPNEKHSQIRPHVPGATADQSKEKLAGTL